MSKTIVFLYLLTFPTGLSGLSVSTGQNQDLVMIEGYQMRHLPQIGAGFILREEDEMLDPIQFRMLIVQPLLKYLEPEIPYSKTAENLLMGTALHESRLYWLKQNGGPALGLFQMEPATHDDIWENFLINRPKLKAKIQSLIPSPPLNGEWLHQQLITNLFYAAAMARVHYFRSSDPLPDNTPEGLADYWKEVYNTSRGAGTRDQFIKHYRDA